MSIDCIRLCVFLKISHTSGSRGACFLNYACKIAVNFVSSQKQFYS